MQKMLNGKLPPASVKVSWEEQLARETKKLRLQPGSVLHFGLWLLFQSKRPSLTTQYLLWLAEQEPKNV